MTLSDYLKQPGVTAVGLASRIGVDHSRVLRWAKSSVPAERVAAVSAATGIPAASLRPDLAAAFTTEPSAVACAAHREGETSAPASPAIAFNSEAV